MEVGEISRDLVMLECCCCVVQQKDKPEFGEFLKSTCFLEDDLKGEQTWSEKKPENRGK